MSSNNGSVEVKQAVGAFTSGARVLEATTSLERRGFVSMTEKTISLTTQALEKLGHPSIKRGQTLEERRASLLKAIAEGDGKQVELFFLDDRDLGLLKDMKAQSLVRELSLEFGGTGVYQITTQGLREFQGKVWKAQEGVREPVGSTSSRPDSGNLLLSVRKHWLFISLGTMLTVGWFLFQNLNPDRICPLLPWDLSEWLERCSVLTPTSQ